MKILKTTSPKIRPNENWISCVCAFLWLAIVQSLCMHFQQRKRSEAPYDVHVIQSKHQINETFFCYLQFHYAHFVDKMTKWWISSQHASSPFTISLLEILHKIFPFFHVATFFFAQAERFFFFTLTFLIKNVD